MTDMIYGYARVSTVAQGLASQLVQLKAAECAEVFCEKITGTTADRPQLRKLMAAIAPGDVVVIPAVDHLSRTGGRKCASGSTRASRSAVSPAATISVRRRFRG
jgi:DNA invertase Pin-like site-specific DNA recombinase